MDEQPLPTSPPPSLRLVVMLWLFGWLLFGMSILSILSVILFGYLWVKAVTTKSRGALLALLLSPPLVLFVVGAACWFTKYPTFIGSGLPSHEASNLHRKTRCYWQSMGCGVDGSEWLTQGPYNLGLSLMNGVFGAPPRTYHGVFPDKAEAEHLTDSGQSIPVEAFRSGMFTLNGEALIVAPALISAWEKEVGSQNESQHEKESLTLRATIAGGECLMIRLTEEIAGTDMIVLIEKGRMKPFARYILEGYVRRFPGYLRE